MNLKYRWMAGEPDLHDMLRDDVVLAVMRRDGVSRQDLDELINRVKHRLSYAADGALAHRGLPRAANDRMPLPQI